MLKGVVIAGGVVYQIGGWTGRESFADVMSDFEEAGGEHDPNTRSSLSGILVRQGDVTIQENFTQHESYVFADVLWIADPTGYDENDVTRIKQY